MGSDNPAIDVGTSNGRLYIGLRGRATQRICPTIERIVGDHMDAESPTPGVVLDLDGCGWIDSTFAGWLVGLQRRIGRVPGGSLSLANCSERCRGSLIKMQLEALFPYEEKIEPADVREVSCDTSDRPDSAALRLMLESHEHLASLSESNARVFGPIVETLKQQLYKV